MSALPENMTWDFPMGHGVLPTSDATKRYNCFAWAAGDDSQNWDPYDSDGYWPPEARRERSYQGLKSAYGTLGYTDCIDGRLEPRVEKIALYCIIRSNHEPVRFTHAARQLASGRWTSKLGPSIDVEHELHELEGPAYGRAHYFLSRPRRG